MANEFQLSYTAQEIDKKLGKIISTINNITPDENGNIVLTNENIVGLQDALDNIKNTYDANNDGIVDNTAMLGGQLPSYYATKTEVETVQSTANDAMPKSGGAFTGIVEANRTNGSGDFIRNICVKDSSYADVSTSSVFFTRK